MLDVWFGLKYKLGYFAHSFFRLHSPNQSSQQGVLEEAPKIATIGPTRDSGTLADGLVPVNNLSYPGHSKRPATQSQEGIPSLDDTESLRPIPPKGLPL